MLLTSENNQDVEFFLKKKFSLVTNQNIFTASSCVSNTHKFISKTIKWEGKAHFPFGQVPAEKVAGQIKSLNAFVPKLILNFEQNQVLFKRELTSWN